MGVATVAQKPKVQLTDRERDVLQGILDEMTYSAIGTKLGVSYETIKSYVTRIRTKLGIRTKSGLAAWATKHLHGA